MKRSLSPRWNSKSLHKTPLRGEDLAVTVPCNVVKAEPQNPFFAFFAQGISGECDMAHRRERDVKFAGQADTLAVLVHQGNEKKRQIKFELVHGRPRSKCRR